MMTSAVGAATIAAANLKPVDDDTSSELPAFSLNELQLRKAVDRNAMEFSVPVRSSVLLHVAKPRPHSYEEKDLRWLHLLQAVAAVPSRKVDTIEQLVKQALQLIPSPVHKKRLELCMRVLLAALEKDHDVSFGFSKRALLALQVKDRVAQFLREWVADPVEGFVLRKEHVVGEFVCFVSVCIAETNVMTRN